MNQQEIEQLVNEYNAADALQLRLLRQIFDAMAQRGPMASVNLGAAHWGANQFSQLQGRFLETFIASHTQAITAVNYGED